MFDTTTYFPTLTTKAGELLAYEHCYPEVKDGMVPIFTLTRYEDTETFADSAAALMSALKGRPAIVDFDPAPRTVTSLAEAAERRRRANLKRVESGGTAGRPRSERQLANDVARLQRTEVFNAGIAALMEPSAGPRRWLDLIASFPDLVPILRLVNEATLREQIAHVRSEGRRAAIRLRVGEPAHVAMVAACADALAEASESLILIVDSGNIWGRVDNSTADALDILRRLARAVGQGFATLTTVVVSTAFPRQPLRSVASTLSISDLSLHSQVAREFDIRLGDYGSLPNRNEDTPARGWFPHVDLVTAGSWQIFLYEENRNPLRYVTASSDAVGSEQWRERADCWGTSIIEQVSRGNQIIDGRKFTHPSPWLSVRINQHLTRMALRTR